MQVQEGGICVDTLDQGATEEMTLMDSSQEPDTGQQWVSWTHRKKALSGNLGVANDTAKEARSVSLVCMRDQEALGLSALITIGWN